MKHQRRDFLRLSTLTRGGFVGSAFHVGCKDARSADVLQDQVIRLAKKVRDQPLEMCGYGADPIPAIRIGLEGMGNHKTGTVSRISYQGG